MEIPVNLVAEPLLLLGGQSGVHLGLGDLVARAEDVGELERVRHLDQIEVEGVSFDVDQDVTLVVDGEGLVFTAPFLNSARIIVS